MSHIETVIEGRLSDFAGASTVTGCVTSIDCPVTEIEDYRMEVLMRVPQLETLDKEDFTADDKLDAEAAYDERKEELDKEDIDEQVLHRAL